MEMGRAEEVDTVVKRSLICVLYLKAYRSILLLEKFFIVEVVDLCVLSISLFGYIPYCAGEKSRLLVYEQSGFPLYFIPSMFVVSLFFYCKSSRSFCNDCTACI